MSLDETESTHRFELHLPGLLKVLAEHLYSSKRVGLRELIQNAHDSCVRRKLEANERDYEPRITLSLRPREKQLIIADNGSGMTAREITDYLSTIGRGYTGQLREQVDLLDSSEAAELIGQFGLGFLSAFLLAESVTVVTRSFRGDPALQWRSAGDGNYDLIESEKAEVGTSVTLQVKQSAAFMLQKHVLVEAIREFADFLPAPIYLDDEPQPLNRMEAPWEAIDADAAAEDYIERTFQDHEPLWIMPLKPAKIPAGQDSLTIAMNGFLYVPNRSVASVREYGAMRIYIRRMFICDHQRDLLPPWARFVRGVIDCPLLQPTASREEIHQDQHFEEVRQMLEAQLTEGLSQLASQEPERWKHLVRCHSDLIVGWAVKDDEFFERIKDLVALRTSRGLLTLPEYLEQSGGAIYFVTRELGSLQEQLLAEGRNVPAIDASWFAVAPFLEKYASSQPGVSLVPLDGDIKSFFQPAPERPFASMVHYLRSLSISARVATFAPRDVPALLVYPQDAELMRDARNALSTHDLPASMAPLLQAYVDDRNQHEDESLGVLYLNASCPYLCELAKRAPDTPGWTGAMRALYQVARLFSGRMLTPGDTAQAFQQLTHALKEMTE